jgi:hypothetical protein
MAKLYNRSRLTPRKSYEATPGEDRLLRAMVAKGASCYRICKTMGISQSAAHRWLAERQLVPASRDSSYRSGLDAREGAEFRAFYQTGASVAALGKKFNLSRITVRRILRDFKLDLPPRAANKNHIRHNSFNDMAANTQEILLYKQRKGADERPRESIAARFRREGLASADPHR